MGIDGICSYWSGKHWPLLAHRSGMENWNSHLSIQSRLKYYICFTKRPVQNGCESRRAQPSSHPPWRLETKEEGAIWYALFAPIKRQTMLIHSEGINRQKEGKRRAQWQRKRWRDAFVELMWCSLSESLGNLAVLVDFICHWLMSVLMFLKFLLVFLLRTLYQNVCLWPQGKIRYFNKFCVQSPPLFMWLTSVRCAANTCGEALKWFGGGSQEQTMN